MRQEVVSRILTVINSCCDESPIKGTRSVDSLAKPTNLDSEIDSTEITAAPVLHVPTDGVYKASKQYTMIGVSFNSRDTPVASGSITLHRGDIIRFFDNKPMASSVSRFFNTSKAFVEARGKPVVLLMVMKKALVGKFAISSNELSLLMQAVSKLSV